MTLASERHELILAAVRQRGTVRLTDLVARLGVTAVTVRRDVTILADRGLVLRVHGGITLPHRGQPAEQRAAAISSPFGRLPGQALVGMVVPTVEFYWPPVIQGAQSAVAAAGGRLALRASAYDASEDRRQVSALLDRGVRTLLIAPTTTGDTGLDLVRWLGGLTIPVMLVERLPPPALPTLPLDAATTAHSLGAGLAVRHLVTLGHHQIAFITARFCPTTVPCSKDGGRPPRSRPPRCEDLDSSCPLWLPRLGRRLRRGTERCHDAGVTALFVHSDREAIGLTERARDRGLTVPDDLAVVSYDDEVAAASDPPRPRSARRSTDSALSPRSWPWHAWPTRPTAPYTASNCGPH